MRILLVAAVVVGADSCATAADEGTRPAKQRMNAALDRPPDGRRWGSNHVAKPVPEFMTGDECLFCHRNDIGARWGDNPHQVFLRPASPDSLIRKLRNWTNRNDKPTEKPDWIMGDNQRSVFLRRSKAFGKLELLSAYWDGESDTIRNHSDKASWDSRSFSESCAGCHSTGVDQTGTFSAMALDCFVCHGVATLDHTKEPKLMLLSAESKTPARVIISICAQCHVRNGHSRSTNRPYANNFVPGDNLMLDFAVDLNPESINSYPPIAKHIAQTVSLVENREKTASNTTETGDQISCLSCHSVHKASTAKHVGLARLNICRTCHPTKNSTVKLSTRMRDVPCWQKPQKPAVEDVQ